MCQKNDLPLSLKSDTFNAFCSDFDQMLRRMLQGMVDTEQDAGEITCKIKVTLTPDSAPDFEVRDHTRAVTKPKFDHTVSSVIQYKDKKTGTLSGNYELVWDRESLIYVMRPIDNGQVSMFDQPTETKVSGEKGIDADFSVVPALEGREPLGLPGGTEDDSGGPEDALEYDKLKEYVGKELCCEWSEDESTCLVRCLNDGEVLVDAADWPEAELEKHVGHNIVCVAFEDDGKCVVSVNCDDCDIVLHFASKPADQAEDKPVSPYDYLVQFEGQELICLEAMGIFTIRAGSTVIISSAAPSVMMLGADGVKKMEAHVGHRLRLVKDVDDKFKDCLVLDCEDCGETIVEVYPPEEGGEYHYEKPGVEDEAV